LFGLKDSSQSMMRRLLVRLGSLCLLALLTAGCQRQFIYVSTPTRPAPVTSSAAERTASITQIKGTVETRSSANGDWKPAGQDQVLAEGNQVRTGGPGSSAVISLTEGSHIYLGANTQLTLTLLNKYLDSLLTTFDLKQGQVWVLLNGGALDVKTPFGIASARNAYLSVELVPQSRALTVTCLQGICGFGTILIPSGYKLANAADNAAPEPMQLADYGAWGVVPEATQLAFMATEAIAQGSATIPAVASATATASPRPTITQRPTATATPTTQPTETETLAPNMPSPTLEPATATATIEPPTSTPFPSPTLPEFQATVTPLPFTPLPPAPIIGRHVVQPGETVFCIARGYGVLPGAIIQANDLPYPSFFVAAFQVLRIPQVQWLNIVAGPVCAPQFTSPFQGLTMPTPASATPAGSRLTVSVDFRCTANCGSQDGTYILHFDVEPSGGMLPYTYDPAQSFYIGNLPHCQTGSGSVTVTSAEGHVVQQTWQYIDSACPPK
jgi:LysM repeat protein